MLNVGTSDTDKDLTKARFQEELNKWFESRGIIADLRSHLRHLMITALQTTQIGLNPSDKTSPKIQAVDLVVAEYLLRHGCHYTLSVFTSEVPTLNGFPRSSPAGVLWGRKPDGPEVGSHKKLNQRHKSYFQKAQVEEIFNALGLSSSAEELERAKISYFENENENSLLELFLQMVLDMSVKLQLRQDVKSHENEEGERRFLSKKWSSKIVDILLNEKIKPLQVSAIQQSIVSITENEIKRVTEEERRREMEVLAEREKRIQEYLTKCEEEILFRLTEAEKELSRRKDIIDEELFQRQRHLSKMVLEWNNKHDDIVRVSKSICNIENENQVLKKTVKELKKENEDLKAREEEQNETISKLRTEANSLRNDLNKVTESNEILNGRIMALTKDNRTSVDQTLVTTSATTICVTSNTLPTGSGSHGPQSEIPRTYSAVATQRPIQDHPGIKADESPKSHHPTKESTEVQVVPQDFVVKVLDKQNIMENSKISQTYNHEALLKEISKTSNDEDEVTSLSRSFSCEEILSEARKKLEDLEEESSRIRKKYFEYKLVYNRSVDSDSDLSKSSSEKSLKNERRSTANLFPDNGRKFFPKANKPSQAEKENKLAEELAKLREWKEQKEWSSSSVRPRIHKIAENTTNRVPTKRQLKNRDYFLKSRQFLQELEAQNVEELQTTTPSIADSSFQATSSNSEETNDAKNVEEEPKDKSIILTPLMTTSFYCNDPPPVSEQKSSRNKDTIPKDPHQTTQFDCLALLEDARIKSPAVSRPSLRQQILLAESEEEKFI